MDAFADDVPYTDDFDTDSRLVRAAKPVVAHLAQQTADIPLGMVLADQDARIIHRIDTTALIGKKLDSISLAPGFDFHESSVGTNAVGTALAAQAVAYIDSAQHFHGRFLNYVCSATPIRDRLTGKIIGVLDITCQARHANTLMRALVSATAAEIERNLLQDSAGSMHHSYRQPESGDPWGPAVKKRQGVQIGSGEVSSLPLSPIWRRVVNDISEHLAFREEFLVTGEAGLGKVSLISDLFTQIAPDGRTVVIEPAYLMEKAPEELFLVSHATDVEILYVLSNVDRLNHRGVKNLLRLVRLLRAEAPRPRIAATAEEKALSSPSSASPVVSFFRHLVTLPMYHPHQLLKRDMSWLETVEYETVCRALQQTEGNRAKAAELLGIARASLYRKMRQYQIADTPSSMIFGYENGRE